jgi:hypothetical protein
VARAGTPWPVIVTVLLCGLVAAGALTAAATLRDRDEPGQQTTSLATPSALPFSGCKKEPCTVLRFEAIGDTRVELLADAGAMSGRLRIGGPDARQVIEVAISGMGAVLTQDSLRCVVGSLSGCLVRGNYPGGAAGQLVVGRSGKWSSVDRQFVAGAGYLGLVDVGPPVGPEVVAAQYVDCDPTTADCTGQKVYAQVYAINGSRLGCTRHYSQLDSLPGFPEVELKLDALHPC